MNGILPVSLVFRRLIVFSLLWAALAYIGMLILVKTEKSHIEGFSFESFNKETARHDKVYSIEGETLNLPSLSFSLALPDFSNQLIAIKETMRPDMEMKSQQFLLLLNSTDKKKLALEEKAYLTYENESYIFSSKHTPLSLIITKDLKEHINVELFVKPEEIVGTTIQSQRKKFKLPLQKEPYSDISILHSDEIFSVLSKAQWLSSDLVFQTLGNKEQKIIGKKQRLKLICLDQHYQCVLDEKDWLYWKDGRWVVTRNLQDAKDVPLARIKSLSSKELEIEGWDAAGKKKYFFLIMHQPVGELSIKPEEMIKSLRLKTKSQVTAQTAKQMLSLRIGDAFYQNEKDNWNVVKNFRCLSKQMKEIEGKSFFVFEKIQKKEGKKFFKGYLFNDTHTFMKPVEILIQMAGVKSFNNIEKKHLPHEKPTLSGR